jgi:hypothetical protein
MAALSGLVASFYAGGMPEDAIVVAGEDFFAEMEEESSTSLSSSGSPSSSCSCSPDFNCDFNCAKNWPEDK